MTTIEQLAALIQAREMRFLREQKSDCEANRNNVKTSVKPGKKYTKIDVGSSGRYMVEVDTNKVFGIKAYGVIHRGHYYGTVDEFAATFNGDDVAVAEFEGFTPPPPPPENDRDAAIRRIKTALEKRSGKKWSVTGGTGTAWGWIEIDAPPRRRTMHCRLKATATGTAPEDYESVDTGEPNGTMTPADREELKNLLCLELVHAQGVSIPSSGHYREEFVDRAEGRTPTKIGTPYWD